MPPAAATTEEEYDKEIKRLQDILTLVEDFDAAAGEPQGGGGLQQQARGGGAALMQQQVSWGGGEGYVLGYACWLPKTVLGCCLLLCP
jgi:hypothetical protein